ncbi:MAG: DUF3105 domain-containing protein [Acidimicrobiia bacterium]
MLAILSGAVLLAIDLSQPEPPPPPELEAVETFPNLGGQHLAPGEATPEYNSDPPTSGPHSETPASCGVYRQPVPDVNYLHSMEHGAIVVQYHSDLAQEQVEELEEMGRNVGGEIIVAPSPDNPAPVVITAWTKLLLLDEINACVIAAFEREYGNRSPEPAAQCVFAVDEGR